MERKIKALYGILIAILTGILPAKAYCQAKPVIKAAHRFDKLSMPASRETYEVSVEDAMAPYQVSVNDVPIFSLSVNGPMTFFVNTAITKSGLQTIKLVESKGGDSKAKVTVKAIRRMEDNIPKKDTLLWSGTRAGTFPAKVAYTVEDWSQGQDLNNKEMIAAATKWFGDMVALLKARKGQAFMDTIFEAEQNAFIANYMEKEEANGQFSGWVSYLNKGSFQVLGIAGCKIEVVGNGKLLHVVDGQQNGGIAIKSENLQTTFFDVFLYAPAGKTTLKPVLINFKQVRNDFRKSR